MAKKAKNWPVGTVVEATCVIIDYCPNYRKDGTAYGNYPRIVARPGELGIVYEHCDPENRTHEVMFSGGLFTSSPKDPAVRLWWGAVSTVCDGQGGHPEQLKRYEQMTKGGK